MRTGKINNMKTINEGNPYHPGTCANCGAPFKEELPKITQHGTRATGHTWYEMGHTVSFSESGYAFGKVA